MSDIIETLKAGMATKAEAFAVIVNGVLDCRTIGPHENWCATRGLLAGGHQIISLCQDPDCRCMVNLLGELMPTAKVVRVTISVTESVA